MRTRFAALFALVLVMSAALPASIVPAHASSHTFAQDDTGSDGDPTGSEDESAGGESGSTDGGDEEGQSDPAAETGAGDEAEEGSTPSGPPWTYQMARIALVLLVLIGVGIALAYRKLVVQRQRAGV
jgi:hypothetical protein